MPEEWGVTPEEKILDYIYESVDNDEWVKILYGVSAFRPEPVLYVEINGVCYAVSAKEHSHVQEGI